jgi:cell filamentation protein
VYATFEDPYCYENSDVLRNKPDFRNQNDLDRFEAAITAQRAEEPIQDIDLTAAAYCRLHQHLFQDVYGWAGRYRTIRLIKGGSVFCYPENIPAEMSRLFNELEAQDGFREPDAGAFITKTARFLSEINAIHPFREGNGRTQNVFLAWLGDYAGHPL